MKKLLIATLLVCGLTGIAYAGGDASAGKKKSTTCAACHGADGNSLVPDFPKLAGQGEKYLVKQMHDIKSGTRPVPTMAGQLDNMSDQDIADLAAYFSSQANPGGAAKDDPELLKLGESIYRAGVQSKGVAACTACHGPQGKGNAPAGFPALAGQHAKYTASQLKMFRAEGDGARTNDAGRIMRDNAYKMSDLEIEAVSNYIAGLR